MVDEKRLLIFL